MKRLNPLMQRAFAHLEQLLAGDPTLKNDDIAKTLGVSAHTVGRWRRELGLANRRDRILSSPDERTAAVNRVQAGESIRQVALDIGREQSTVFVWCRKAGVASRHEWRAA